MCGQRQRLPCADRIDRTYLRGLCLIADSTGVELERNHFSFKAQTFIARDFNVALSCQKATYSDSTRGKATAVSEQNKIVVEFVAHF